MPYELVRARFVKVEDPFSVIEVVLDLGVEGFVVGHVRFENDGRDFEVAEDLQQHEVRIRANYHEIFDDLVCAPLLWPELEKGRAEYEKQQS